MRCSRAITALAAALVLTATGCGYDGPMLTVHELRAGLDDPGRNITVIDVRPAVQFGRGHVPGARNLPLEELDSNESSIAAIEGEVALICTCGKRALAAAKQLAAVGETVIFVEGGYKEWTAAGYPLEQGK